MGPRLGSTACFLPFSSIENNEDCGELFRIVHWPLHRAFKETSIIDIRVRLDVFAWHVARVLQQSASLSDLFHLKIDGKLCRFLCMQPYHLSLSPVSFSRRDAAILVRQQQDPPSGCHCCEWMLPHAMDTKHHAFVSSTLDQALVAFALCMARTPSSSLTSFGEVRIHLMWRGNRTHGYLSSRHACHVVQIL